MTRASARSLKVFNIGYQNRRIGEFCATLSEAGVRIILDVRAVAWSQRPEFRKTALATVLSEHGIGYQHCKLAGNPFRAASKEPNGWVECERRYREYVFENASVLDAVEDAVRVGHVALFCYESQRTGCHRGVLLDELTKRLQRIHVVDL